MVVAVGPNRTVVIEPYDRLSPAQAWTVLDWGQGKSFQSRLIASLIQCRPILHQCRQWSCPWYDWYQRRPLEHECCVSDRFMAC